VSGQDFVVSSVDGDLSLPPRTLPVSGGASGVLREAIASGSPTERRQELVEAVPQTDEEWFAFQAAADGAAADEFRAAVGSLPVSVEHEVMNGVNVYHVVPDNVDQAHEDHLFVHVHGGAYVLFGGEACYGEALVLALGAGIRTVSIDYRMPPNHPYPTPVDDVVAVYRHLSESRTGRSMAMGGSSAGGGITLSAVQRLIKERIDVPGTLFIGTPGADLSGTGDTIHTNQGVDTAIPTFDGLIEAAVRLYAGGLDLTDPKISPIYGEFEGFPPTILVSGTRDLFLSNTVRTHIRLRQAGVDADLLVYEGMSHSDYIRETTAPESQHFLAELDQFLIRHLQASQRSRTRELPHLEASKWT